MEEKEQIDISLYEDMLVGKSYRHFKGERVKVISIAIHTETLEPMVVYVDSQDNTWVRPLYIFLSPVDVNKYPDSNQIFRFEVERGE